MGKWRFTLGKTLNTGTNYVSNGNFDLGIAGWTAEPGWAWNISGGGHARLLAATQAKLSQAGVFEVGEKYQVNYKFKKDSTNGTEAGFNVLRINEAGLQADYFTSTSYVDFSRDRIAFSDELVFDAESPPLDNMSLDTVSAYKYEWNDPLNDEPIGWDEAEIEVKRDRELDGLFKRYINNLTFRGDGYDFIKSVYDSDGVCGEIDVRIEYSCNNDGNFEDFFIGRIYIEDTMFDRMKCQVGVRIEDVGDGDLIIKNKNKKQYPSAQSDLEDFNEVNRNGLINAIYSLELHDSGGTYSYTKNAWNVFDLLKRMVHYATDLQMDVESDFFTGATWEYFSLSFGGDLRSAGSTPAQAQNLSFVDLFENLNRIFSLDFRIYRKNNIPTIKIEPKVDLRTVASVLTLNNVPKLRHKFDTRNNYSSVSIGYNRISGSDYSKGVEYATDGGCGRGTKDLVADGIQDSQLIFDLLDGSITDDDEDNRIVFLEVFDDSGTLRTKRFTASNLYNGNIDPDDNMDRWVENLYYSYVQVASLGDEATKADPPIVVEWDFDYPISYDDYLTLAASPSSRITFNSPEHDIADTDAFVVSLRYKIRTHQASWKVLSE